MPQLNPVLPIPVFAGPFGFPANAARRAGSTVPTKVLSGFVHDTFKGTGTFNGHVANTGQVWNTDLAYGAGVVARLNGDGTVEMGISDDVTLPRFLLNTGAFNHLRMSFKLTRRSRSGDGVWLATAIIRGNNITPWDFSGIVLSISQGTNFPTTGTTLSVTAGDGGSGFDDLVEVPDFSWAEGATKTVAIVVEGQIVSLYINSSLVGRGIIVQCTSLNTAAHSYVWLRGIDSVIISDPGTPASGYPTLFTQPFDVFLTADPAKSFVALPDGYVGSTTSGLVITNLTSGGDDVAVSGVVATVVDNGDGTYTVSYNPTKVGTDTLTITINGAPISNSPKPTRVLPPRPPYMPVTPPPTTTMPDTPAPPCLCT